MCFSESVACSRFIVILKQETNYILATDQRENSTQSSRFTSCDIVKTPYWQIFKTDLVCLIYVLLSKVIIFCLISNWN